jgi:putative ABC transport system permease protein
MNVEIIDPSVPLWVLLLLVALGIFVPIVISAVPVIRGSRISVRAALDNFGVNLKSSPRLFANNETLKISIRNVFRQRWRLALTLALLGSGGAIFMTAMNVSDAWSHNLKRIGKQRIYDLEVKFDQRIPIDSLLSKIKSTEGVKDVEAWDFSATSFGAQGKFETTHTYPDQGHGSFTAVAVPVNTNLLRLDIVDGTWLHEENPNGIVLNQMARLMKPDLKIGDDIILSVEDSTTEWRILGFSEDVGSGATVYLPMDTFQKLASSNGQSKSVRISYNDRSRENANIMNAKMERLFEQEKVAIDSMIPVNMLRNAIAGHMKVLINSLIGIAILMAMVGAIGLMSTMSMSVMERTREIGVMRAIGATPNKITFIIAFEGLTIGLISIAMAIVLGIGLSYFLGRYIGSMAFRTPLSLSISWMALVAWIMIILVGSYLASWIPARRAGRITTREALAYE